LNREEPPMFKKTAFATIFILVSAGMAVAADDLMKRAQSRTYGSLWGPSDRIRLTLFMGVLLPADSGAGE